MSNGIDPLKDVFHLSDQEKKAVQSAASVIGSISSIWGAATGAINATKSVLTALGVLSASDQVSEMRQLIDQLRHEFDGAVAALDKEQSMRAVADQVQLARTQLDQLTEFAPEDAATVGLDPVWDELRPLVLNGSLQAVNTLGDPAYWKRVFFPELLYNWPPRELHPAPVVESAQGLPSGLVFDYRLTLPAYLEVIAIRLTILVAVMKDYQHRAVPELTHMATTLEGYFKQIRGGIYEVLFVPIAFMDDIDNPFQGLGSWTHEGSLVGAVEMYSAVDRVAPWPDNEFPRTGFPGQSITDPDTTAEWFKFLVRYAVRNWVRWKQVYDAVGLNAAARTLVALKRMAGIDPATLPAPSVAPDSPVYTGKKIRDGDYSMKELAEMMHDIGLMQWGYWPILDATGKLRLSIHFSELKRLLQTYQPQPYASFREALRQ